MLTDIANIMESVIFMSFQGAENTDYINKPSPLEGVKHQKELPWSSYQNFPPPLRNKLNILPCKKY